MTQDRLNKKYLFLVSMTAGLGGFLFGFDTAVASGTIGFLRVKFTLNEVMEGWIMSSALLGSVMGAAISGYFSDKFGRRLTLKISALLFLVSAFGTALPETETQLVIFRLIGGMGVGIAAMVSPLFIAELAPPHLRGRLVSIYQLAITMGILVSYVSNGLLLQLSDSVTINDGGSLFHKIFVDEVWRSMFGSEIVPAALFLSLLFLVPKSPRWLTKEGHDEKAFKILKKVHGKSLAKKEMNEIKETIQQEKGGIGQLFGKKLRRALTIGIVIPMCAQFTGIPTVMYYAPSIFEKAGFQLGSAFGAAALIGFFNMIFTFVAIWRIDRWGRKPMLISGFLGLGLALLAIGYQFLGVNDGGAPTISVFLMGSFIIYIAFFASTTGPGPWVVISEIYPTKIRGRAMAIGTLSLFVASTIVTQTFPMLREAVGIGATFWIYAAFMVPAALFVWKMMPETKGRTLEEIEKYWESGLKK